MGRRFLAEIWVATDREPSETLREMDDRKDPLREEVLDEEEATMTRASWGWAQAMEAPPL